MPEIRETEIDPSEAMAEGRTPSSQDLRRFDPKKQSSGGGDLVPSEDLSEEEREIVKLAADARNIDQVEESSGTPEEEKEDDPGAPVQPGDDLGSVLFGHGDAVEWEIGPEGFKEDHRYIQRELGFFAKQEVIGLAGAMLDEAMSGPRALTLRNLFDLPEDIARKQRDPTQLTVADFRDADVFVQALGKLITYVPQYGPDLYCIILQVPDFERQDVVDAMKLPPEQGGISDEDGFEMLHIFLEQNYVGLQRFFREFLAVRDKAQHLRNETSQSQPSKPSKRIRRRTPTRH